MAAISSESPPRLGHQPQSFYGKLDTQIGKGTYGNIFLTDRNYVVKIIKYKPNDIGPAILSEIVYPICLDHPSIIKYHDVYIDDTSLETSLIMDRYDGDLTMMKIRGNRPAFLSVAKQLITGLAYLSSRNIIHRDIKPQNIFFRKCPGSESDASPRYQVVYADFGLSVGKECMITEKLSNNVYTYWFRAPEIALGVGPYNSKADVWALGCTLYAIYTHRFLFTPSDAKELVFEIAERIGLPEPGSFLYSRLRDIIAVLKEKPVTRPRTGTLVADTNINRLLLDMIDPDSRTRKSVFLLQENPLFYEVETTECYDVSTINEDSCFDRYSLFARDASVEAMKNIMTSYEDDIIVYINFMILLKHDFHMSNTAYSIALDVFFRYLALQPGISADEIVPITVACLYIGSNFFDERYVKLDEFLAGAAVKATIETVHQIVIRILREINYDLMASTPYDKMQAVRFRYTPEIVGLAGQLLVSISSVLSLYTRPDIGILCLKMAAKILGQGDLDEEIKLLFAAAIEKVYGDNREMLAILPARLEAYFLF